MDDQNVHVNILVFDIFVLVLRTLEPFCHPYESSLKRPLECCSIRTFTQFSFMNRHGKSSWLRSLCSGQ